MVARRALSVLILLQFTLVAFAAPRRKEPDQPTPGATVLCYHIVEAPAAPRMNIDRATFRQHLQYLEMTGYNVIPLRHLYEYVSGTRASLPRNAHGARTRWRALPPPACERPHTVRRAG